MELLFCTVIYLFILVTNFRHFGNNFFEKKNILLQILCLKFLKIAKNGEKNSSKIITIADNMKG